MASSCVLPLDCPLLKVLEPMSARTGRSAQTAAVVLVLLGYFEPSVGANLNELRNFASGTLERRDADLIALSQSLCGPCCHLGVCLAGQAIEAPLNP